MYNVILYVISVYLRLLIFQTSVYWHDVEAHAADMTEYAGMLTNTEFEYCGKYWTRIIVLQY